MPALSIAGFWRRTGAFLIDILLLGIVGWIAGTLLFDTLAKLGSYGRAVGFVVAMAYFVPLDSRLGRGQTLGKRMFGVRVVDAQGQCPSVSRALLRYAVIGVPFFLNGFFMPTDGWNAATVKYVVSPALSLIVFGGLLSLAYLFVFNRRTRQSPHDLIAGCYVVRVKNTQPAQTLQPLWRVHAGVVDVIALLSLAVPIIVAAWFKPPEQLTSLLHAQRQLSAFPSVHRARVSDISNSINGQKTHYVSVTLWLNAPNQNDPALAKDAARIVAAHNSALAKQDSVLVRLIHGYDIGIASAWRSRSYQFKPEEQQTF